MLIEKIDGFKNNPEKFSTTNISEHIPSGFLLYIMSLFNNIENKHVVYRAKDRMKNFYDL